MGTRKGLPHDEPNQRGSNIRGVRLEDVCDSRCEETSDESIVPHVLPAFLLVLLAGLHAEKPAGRGVIVITMVRSTEVAASRKALGGPGGAKKGARAKGMRQWSSRHCGCEIGCRGLKNSGVSGV